MRETNQMVDSLGNIRSRKRTEGIACWKKIGSITNGGEILLSWLQSLEQETDGKLCLTPGRS